MPIVNYFGHGSIRKIVVAFATLFNGYQIKKPDDTMVEVPIQWSSKQKWYTQLTQNADKDNKTAITLPRMGFVVSDLTYDYNRKVSSLNKLAFNDPDNADRLQLTYAPSPYIVSFDLFIATRTIDEGLQLLEQIVPFFTPSFNVTIEELDGLNIERDVPIKLDGINLDLNTEGSFDGDDMKVWDLQFSCEIDLYKNLNDRSIIKKVVIDMHPTLEDNEESIVSRSTAEVDPNTAFVGDVYEILKSLDYVEADLPKI